MASGPRIIHLVHATRGRVRLRLSWLRDARDEAHALADQLAALDESVRVEVRPWTGSVLCTFEDDRLDAERVLAAVRRHTQVAAVVRFGEPSPEARAEYARTARTGIGTLTRAVGKSVRSLNQEVLRSSEGRLDLGAVTGLGFLALGASEIAATRSAPAPPWFNLAWWAFRTFTLFHDEDEQTGEGAGDTVAGEPGSDPD